MEIEDITDDHCEQAATKDRDLSQQLASRENDSFVPTTSMGMTDSGDAQKDKQLVNIDHGLIETVSGVDELEGLGLTVYNQQQFEQGIIAQVEDAISKDEEVRRKKKLQEKLPSVIMRIRQASREVSGTERKLKAFPTSRTEQLLKTLKEKLENLQNEKKSIEDYISGRSEEIPAEYSDLPMDHIMGQDDADNMIKTGEKTPFGSVANQPGSSSTLTAFERYLADQAKPKVKKKSSVSSSTNKPIPKVPAKVEEKKEKRGNIFDAKGKHNYRAVEKDMSDLAARKLPRGKRVEGEWRGGVSDEEEEAESDDEWKPSMDEWTQESEELTSNNIKKSGRTNFRHKDIYTTKEKASGKKGQRRKAMDDANEKSYKKRMLRVECEKQEKMERGEDEGDSDVEIDGGFRVPASLWNKLYRYQQTGVRWLWELHCQKSGGILGDEMGLGKTIQTIAFLAGLQTSGLPEQIAVDPGVSMDTVRHHRGLGPVLIVCPATVLHQWVKELHTWWPAFRVAILHSSGSNTGSQENLVRWILRTSGVLVAAYSSVLIYQHLLLPQPWHYVFLDEGHKIRNPDAQITIACKQLKTHHRVILSGSPMQNNLKELWCLFDFVFPGKLGTLPEFMQHVSVPIVQGGYSNATQIQVQTAYRCACMLRDTISPYLLRRMKADVQNTLQLPSKNEQVLFCRLTPDQREVYQEYLNSKECNMILNGRYMVFPGLVTLRKVCNHPDISTGGLGVPEDSRYGDYTRSGKMVVIVSLLKIWSRQKHKVLLFSQSKEMLNILEEFIKGQGYTYLRMDGGTPIASRQTLVSTFNQDSSIFVFLLTTRVGGLGVNLTGADRVVIYDPDWNPSTDLQARERAWRIGQQRDVTVYRLLTAGTIEEKIYHRQIFKQFLTNRVLKDPRQRRFFKSNNLYELFSLTDDSPDQATETSAIFAGTGSDLSVKPAKRKKRNRFDEMKQKQEDVEEESLALAEELGLAEPTATSGVTSKVKVDTDKEVKDESEDDGGDSRKKKLRELARKLSLQFGDKSKNGQTDVVDSGVELPSTSSHSTATHKHRKKQKRKKQKRKVRDAKFEGERISGLAKQGAYQPGGEEKEEESSSQQDNYVLRKLFKKAGVHSVMQHDTLMESGQADYALVESEARRVASQAAKALRQSRSQCLREARHQPGVPTWTGKQGAVGAPRFGQKRRSDLQDSSLHVKKNKKPLSPSQEDASPSVASTSSDKIFDGKKLFKSTTKSQASVVSSSDLLADMRARRVVSSESSAEDSATEEIPQLSRRPKTSVKPPAEHVELMSDIRDFVAFGASIDGQASTQEIMDKFADKVPPNLAPQFKAMLKQVCDLDKSSGVGIWRLKQDFR